MKTMIFAMITAAALSASANLVTVTVCNRGEGANVCETISYKARPATAPTVQPETCVVGNVDQAPCPTVYGVPKWIQDLNKWAASHGLKSTSHDDGNFTGGSN